MTGSATLAVRVAAARDGDRAAWDSLVEQYMPLVLGVARRYRLCPEDVADASQAVWLRLVEHLDDIREPRALPGWIVTTTKNEALRLLSTRQRAIPVDPLTSLALNDVPDDESVEDDLLRLERHQALREGLRELRPQHRALLQLLLSDPPLSYDDISRQLGIPKGSIGPTRARCLEALRNTAALSAFLCTSDSETRR
jgi:RNA polymerase sigma factor (sigma-70 family)